MMKKMQKVLAVLLTVASIICMTGFTTNAAANGTAINSAAAANIFEGYTVTVLDKTTPAVNIYGRSDDRTVMCFMSASDQEVGVISYNDFNTIIQKYQKVVNLPGGGTYGAPPIDGIRWEEWFADEFNKYRGLDDGSREVAVETHTVETVEQYRQEVIALVNAEREKSGLPALYADDAAMEYAQERAQELVTSYSHTRPDNKEKPYDELGAMNENIAKGQISPAEVVEDWMNSPGHRANILNDDAYAISVGCYPTGPSFRWVQEFLW